MSFSHAMTISASGLSAQRVRMNLLSTNLANAQTTRTPEGGPYRRQDVIFSALDLTPDSVLSWDRQTALKKVEVTGIYKDMNDPKRVYQPHHEDADAEGFVEMPNVQVMTEMVNMMAATRAYEANATAFNEAKSIALKALDLGRA
jgi:flagellar basal-body rod protein FlgC